VPQRGLRWNKIINLRVQTNNRLISDVTGAIMLGRAPCIPGVDQASGGFLLRRHRSLAQASGIDVSPKT
jgi:hypothetical protein